MTVRVPRSVTRPSKQPAVGLGSWSILRPVFSLVGDDEGEGNLTSETETGFGDDKVGWRTKVSSTDSSVRLPLRGQVSLPLPLLYRCLRLCLLPPCSFAGAGQHHFSHFVFMIILALITYYPSHPRLGSRAAWPPSYCTSAL